MKRKNVAQDWFVRQVAEGDSSLDADKIEKISEQLGVFSGSNGYFCVAVQLEDMELMVKDISISTELLNACIYAGKTQMKDSYCYIGQFFRIVMVVSNDGLPKNETASRLFHSISKHISQPVRMGVGEVYASLEKLNYSRVEAYEALCERSVDSPISYIDDIYVSRSITTYKYSREKRQIVEFFKNGEIEALKASVVRLVENVRAGSPVRADQPYPTSIRRTVIELLVEIMHIAADTGVNVDERLNYEDPYSKILEMQDTPAILSWFIAAVEKLSCCIAEQSSKADNSMLLLAKRVINDQLGNPELSLSLVSGELDITPSYFSAFFIREVGIGFNEYITGLRIERAKQLLSETNSRINSIAGLCGFRSASYFIVVFRKLTGMSPGEYRNMKNA